ncbi:MAG: hypothetical protein L6461_20725 [Anaerolineae bacterium]|nr:hypothetical protein [Anaerolineae bacterium]
MNEQIFTERVNTPGNTEQTGQDVDRLAADSDPYGRSTPLAGTLVNETTDTGPDVDLVPLDDEIVQEAPMGQTIIYDKDSMGETFSTDGPDNINVDFSAKPLSHEEAEQFNSRWNEIQVGFVDEPRLAVEQADALLNEVIEKIAQKLASEHNALEGRWKENNDISTEDLRQALQGYHAFINRLLA